MKQPEFEAAAPAPGIQRALTMAAPLWLILTTFGCTTSSRPRPQTAVGPLTRPAPATSLSAGQTSGQAAAELTPLVKFGRRDHFEAACEKLRALSGHRTTELTLRLEQGPPLPISWLGEDFPRRGKLNLTLYLTPQAIFLSGVGGVHPQVPCPAGIDACLGPTTTARKKLTEMLVATRQAFPEENALTVTAAPRIPMVAVLAAARLARVEIDQGCTLSARCSFRQLFITTPEVAGQRVYLLEPGATSRLLPSFNPAPQETPAEEQDPPGATKVPRAIGGHEKEADIASQIARIRARVVQMKHALRECYQRQLERRVMDIKATLTLRTGPAGAIAAVYVRGLEGAPLFQRCVEGMARSWTLPATQDSEIVVPLVFTAKDSPAKD